MQVRDSHGNDLSLGLTHEYQADVVAISTENGAGSRA
jgi:hypothetical protein